MQDDKPDKEYKTFNGLKLVQAIKSAGILLDNPTLQIPQLLLFLEVGNRQEVNVASLSEIIGYGNATVSKNIVKMDQRGLGLLESFEDKNDYRKKIVRLSSQGKEAYSAIIQHL